MRHNSFFGHPSGLYVLFFTEMWERFSFYGMRALLILYMTEDLLVNPQIDSDVLGMSTLRSALQSVFGPLSVQALASQIYGLYTGLVYFTPILGGILADRVLGQRRSIITGGILMAIGHFLMVQEALFLFALFFLILGNGCFKPNISTQLGMLYPSDDPRRDGAFTLFYMGINLGAFFSPLVCGTLAHIYGWHMGFSAAGFGMVFGLLIYLIGGRFLPGKNLVRKYETSKSGRILTLKQWQSILVLISLSILNIVFWAVYEQQGNTLQLFIEHRTDRQILGWEMPSTWFQALNPLFIIFLAPFLDMVTIRLAAKQRDLSIINKMALGAALLGTAFWVLSNVVAGLQSEEKIAFQWLLLCTVIYTVGELYLSPIGLSLVSKVAPPHLTGMLMGVWFLSVFFGNLLSGYLGSFYLKMSNVDFFGMLAGLAFCTSFAIFALQKLLNKVNFKS
jgi:proton-dependent oligopeptide transporter, POT family